MTAKNIRKPRAKKVILIIILALVLFPLVRFIINYSLYEISLSADPTTDLANYRDEPWAGWIYDDPYAVFPEEDVLWQATDRDYLYKRVFSLLPILYDNEIIAYLKCSYLPETYEREKDRLAKLCGDIDKKWLPQSGYLYAGRASDFYEYALIDDATCTIHYITYQHRGFAEEYLDAALLPKQIYVTSSVYSA